MVGFNLSAEDRDRLIAEYEAQAEASVSEKPQKHAVAEGADVAHKKQSAKPKSE
jgi:hypothetical protein